jgi:hypothetical protein
MTPPLPKRSLPPDDWPHHALLKNVKEALYSVPSYFRTQTNIEGISATDIFTLNAALGATIENQVVETLNQMRSVWDPVEEYVLYSFVRQSQTFPDVLLRRSLSEEGKGDDIILGIELKGWYLLAKEGEPSFRFQVTPKACAAQDLIVVVPWALSNVISGQPRLYSPYIEYARYAAEYRNYHWTTLRQSKSDLSVDSPANVTPYPAKSDRIADLPRSDAGGNFGRYARTGLMDNYLERTRNQPLCGIRAEHWLRFFKIFQDQKDAAQVRAEIEKLRNRVSAQERIPDSQRAAVAGILDHLVAFLDTA